MLISFGETGKKQLEPGQESMAGAVMLSRSLLRNRQKNQPACWSIFVKEKPTFGSPFLGVFSSDLIPKAKKEVNVPFFIHSLPHAGNILKLLRVFFLHFFRKCVHLGFIFYSNTN